MKIAIDLDGVLADASKIWMRLLNERFDIKVDKSNVDQWDFWKKIGISKKAFEENLWSHDEKIKETSNYNFAYDESFFGDRDFKKYSRVYY